MWTRICDPELLQQMIVGNSARESIRWLTTILIIVLTLGVLSISGPSWRPQSYPIMESASARVVVLDLSQSMLVEDVKPTRFAHAVSAAREILASDFEGETGLVVFAGAAFVVSPLSRDADTLLAFLEALDPSTMPEDGTRLDLAITSAKELLLASITGNGQIFVITAADSKREESIQIASDGADLGHSVSILAIGTPEGGPLPDPNGGLLRDSRGKLVLSRANFALMERITQAGKGSIVTLKTSTGYADLLTSRLGANQLIETEQLIDKSTRDAANDGIWMVWLMLPFTVLLFRKNLLWMILLGLLLPDYGELQASEWSGFWTHPEQLAFEAYQQGDYQTCYELSSNPSLQAAAYYKSGKYPQALALYQDDLTAQATFNRGNTLTQQHRFQEAILAYQQALLLDPELVPARHNKRLLELYLEQQSENENGLADDSIEGDSTNSTQDQSGADTRIGISEQRQTNPADDLQLGPGLGATTNSGQVDPFEHFDGLEQDPERFVLRAQSEEQQRQFEFIERWIETLPETSTDLYRRKFLRDYERQKRQLR